MLTELELTYRQWCETPDFPHLDERQAQYARTFIERLQDGSLAKPLYRHQYEAIMHVIFYGEKLGKWDSLMDIVTGGWKTVIMSALIAYFRMVRGYTKFLILVPWKIVRERVKDDFEPTNPWFAYADFPFFFPPFQGIPKKLVTKILRERWDAASIKDADIIIANIHQLYEGKSSEALEILLSDTITPDIVILNDEAHNAAAREYREVLKLLRRKTVARVDLTATPYRLDKQDLDTYPPIYEYQVQQAMRDNVVKHIVVTKPDIKSVKLQYEEWDDENQMIRTLDAEEMPWEQIEKELQSSGAVKFVTAKTARRQQLQIAQSAMDYQKQCVPRDHNNNPQWNPLMLVVALSQNDAWQVYETLQKPPFNYKVDELLLVHSKQDERQNEMAFLLSRKWPEWLPKDKADMWHQTRKIRVIIAVSMLREWWDVRNIAVICLFRKFSYQKKWDTIHTVYWPQIIGRGLRRIRQPWEKDLLFAIDHPAFSHKWLWELLSATEYAKSFNPGDTVNEDDIVDIPVENKNTETENTDNEEAVAKDALDIESIISGLPEWESVAPVADWKKYFDDIDFSKRIASAVQNITNIKSNLLWSDNTAHILPEENINTEELNKTDTIIKISYSRAEMLQIIRTDIIEEPHRIMMMTYKSETGEDLVKITEALFYLTEKYFQIGSFDALEHASEETLRKMLFVMPQIFDEIKNPSVILSILAS